MTILWDKKLIRLSDGSYIAWGFKRKKFFFANKNELKLNCAIIEYYEEREKCDKKVISDLNKMIAELEKENAELDCQKNRNKSCYSCANATERCFKNEIGCPCQKYKSYKDEITELQNRNGELAGQKASLERWLGEAKAIIKNVIRVTWGEGWNYSLDVKVKAEQFLKELEK